MYRTAESVSPKHPDKLCDQISDLLLDKILAQDPTARVAIETIGGHGVLLVTGEVTTNARVDYAKEIHNYLDLDFEISVNIVEQSPFIAQGVDVGGAGDQGIMVGYACNENEAQIPQESWLSRDLNKKIFTEYPFDGKTQITLKDGQIESVVASFQNSLKQKLKVLVEEWLSDKDTVAKPTIHLNPAGDWDKGGFESDAGLTGRKLAVDNYGPRIPIGGGAFSGKDPTKVDRSAAYMARKIAVDLLNAKDAQEVYVYLAYAIGVAEPVHAEAIIDGETTKITGYDLTPAGIIKFLDLRKPQFLATAKWGHMGNGFKWDKI